MSAGPALSKTKRDLLTQTVILEKQVLTYRVAARLFKCNVRDARHYLRIFHDQSDGRTHATCLVTGYIPYPKPAQLHARDVTQGGDALDEDNTISSGSTVNGIVASSAEQAQKLVNGSHSTTMGDVDMEGSQEYRNTAPASQGDYVLTQSHVRQEEQPTAMHCVMLVPEDELESKLTRFTTVLSNEIYSLECTKLPDLVMLTEANSSIYTDAALASIGGEILGTIAPSPKRVARAVGLKRKAPEADVSTSTTAKAKPGPTSDLGTSATSASVAPTSISKTGSTSTITASKAPTLSRQLSGSNMSAKVKTAQDAGPSKLIPDSKPSATSVKSKVTTAPSTDEYDHMYDDEDGMMTEIEDVPANVDLINKAVNSASTATAKPNTSPKERMHKSRNGRKTRRVVKKITTKNEKGFRITREVETDESYSGSDGDAGDTGGSAVLSKSSAQPVESSSSVTNVLAPTDNGTNVRPTTNNLKRKDSGSKPTTSISSKPKKSLPPGAQQSLGSFFGKPKAKN